MRKQFLLYAALLAALLFAACAGKGASQSSGQSSLAPQASASMPQAGSGSPQAPAADSAVSGSGDAQAPLGTSQPTAGGRALSAGEMEELWAKLAGKWLLSDENAWDSGDSSFACPVYDFRPLRTEEGYYTLMEYSAYGSGGMQWDFAEAKEENGVYTLTAVREYGEMSVYECEPGSGTQYTLRFDGAELSIGWERPTCVWEEKGPTDGPPIIYTVRLAAPKEEQRLARDISGEGRMLLENGSFLVAGFRQEAALTRKVTDRKIEQIQGVWPSDDAHVLTEEEKSALWQELAGVWCLADGAPEPLELDALKEIVSFERYENGQYALHTGLRDSEYVSYFVDVIWEEDGVYTFESNQSWGMMYCNEYEPEAGDVFRLSRREDGMLILSVRNPARYGQPGVILTEEGDEISGRHWRLATAEEEQKELTNGTDGFLTLENGDTIVSNYSGGLTNYRLETQQKEGAD